MIRLATKQAHKSSFYFQLGAVIVKGHRVLATGFNKIAHCKVNQFRNSRHAEMDAILKLMQHKEGLSSLAGATLYVSRITKSGVGLARPCPRCLELAKSVGIKEIIYTSSNSTSIKERL